MLDWFYFNLFNMFNLTILLLFLLKSRLNNFLNFWIRNCFLNFLPRNNFFYFFNIFLMKLLLKEYFFRFFFQRHTLVAGRDWHKFWLFNLFDFNEFLFFCFHFFNFLNSIKGNDFLLFSPLFGFWLLFRFGVRFVFFLALNANMKFSFLSVHPCKESKHLIPNVIGHPKRMLRISISVKFSIFKFLIQELALPNWMSVIFDVINQQSGHEKPSKPLNASTNWSIHNQTFSDRGVFVNCIEYGCSSLGMSKHSIICFIVQRFKNLFEHF